MSPESEDLPALLPLNREERRLRGKIAAHALHSKHDPHETTVEARKRFLAGFEKQVDPKNTLPEEERQRRALHALQAHMCKLALASARARRAKAQRGSNPKPSPQSGNQQVAAAEPEADDAQA